MGAGSCFTANLKPVFLVCDVWVQFCGRVACSKPHWNLGKWSINKYVRCVLHYVAVLHWQMAFKHVFYVSFHVFNTDVGGEVSQQMQTSKQLINPTHLFYSPHQSAHFVTFAHLCCCRLRAGLRGVAELGSSGAAPHAQIEAEEEMQAEASGVASQLRGLSIATCCHHRCAFDLCVGFPARLSSQGMHRWFYTPQVQFCFCSAPHFPAQLSRVRQKRLSLKIVFGSMPVGLSLSIMLGV